MIAVPRQLSTLPFLLLTLALASSCGPSSAPAGSTAGNPHPSARPQEENGFAGLFQRQTIERRALTHEARPTITVFFASWCGPCRKELGVLKSLRERYPKLRIIGINAYEDYQNVSDQERLRSFLAESAPWLTEVVVADPALMRSFGGVKKIPSLFVFNEVGRLVGDFRRSRRPPPSLAELDRLLMERLDHGVSD